jgi:hypothetical protein
MLRLFETLLLTDAGCVGSTLSLNKVVQQLNHRIY